jgi:hypothetical protein
MNYDKNDTLVLLFHELMYIIIYGKFNDLVSYSKKVYDLNIQTNKYDPIGFRIKNFILLYLNDVIETKLLGYERR